MFDSIKLILFFSLILSSNLLSHEPLSNHHNHQDIKKVFVLEKWEPYYFINEEGKPDGYAVEIFEKIAKELHIQYEYVIFKEWHKALELIKKGEIDIIPSIGMSDSRKEFITYSNTLDNVNISLFKLKSASGVNSLNNFKNKKIGVVKKNVGKKIIENKYKELQTIAFNSHFEAIRALIEKKIDIICYPEPLLEKTLYNLNLQDRIIKFGQPIANVERAMGFTKANSYLTNHVNQIIEKMEQNGELKQCYNEWFKKGKDTNFNYTALLLFIIVLSLLFFLYLYRQDLAQGEKKRILSLFFIFLFVVFITMLLSLYFMYQTAYEEQKQRLIDTAKTKARLIESINKFDTMNFLDQGQTVEDAFKASMSQVIDAHSQSTGIGKTGEFTLAKLEGDQIVFILTHKHLDFDDPKPVPLNSTLAEPMRLALAGISGTIEGKDYRGELVLAAVEPVYTTTRLGLVAKIDIKEIREPFIQTALFSTFIAVVLVLLGTLGFLKVTNPIIRKIKESEKKYKNIVETANEAILIVDQNDHISFANDQAYNLLGFEKNDTLLGKNYSKLVPKEYLESYKIKREDRKQGIAENYETQLLQKNNKPFWVIVSASPILDTVNKFNGVLLMITNINERKESEEKLEQARIEAEKANEAKSLFLSNISHEIRTPLNGIIGLTQLTLDTELNPKQSYYLSKVQASSKSLLHIINDILDYSKIQSKQFHLENEPFNLYELLDNISGLFGFEIEKKGLELQFNIDNNVHNNFIGDQLRLSQILINFVGNAIKFTSKGEITISVSSRTIDKNICALLFSVKDTGIGIKEEDQDKLFTKFTQVDDSYKRKYEGTGLGLAISKEFVNLMGGDVCLESTYGEGSTFYFTVQLEIDTTKDKNLDRTTIKKNTNDLRSIWGADVLLVEDNEINQTVAKAYLENNNLNVTLANNGEEALEKVKKEDFDLILMDLQMPVMDGIEATKEIKKLKGKKDIPVVAMTAAAMKQDKEKTKEIGMIAHINKPINQTILENVLLQFIKPHKQGRVIQKTEKKENPSIKIDWKGFKQINTQKLLDKLQFDETLALNLLSTFATKYSDIDHILNKEQLENEEFNRFIHSLKGESGNLCLTDIHTISKKIDKREDDSNLANDIQLLKETIRNVIAEIKAFLDDDSSRESSQTISLDEMISMVNKFIKKLQNNYIISFEESNELLEQLKFNASKNKIIVLKEALENLEYNNAKDVLEKILTELEQKD